MNCSTTGLSKDVLCSSHFLQIIDFLRGPGCSNNETQIELLVFPNILKSIAQCTSFKKFATDLSFKCIVTKILNSPRIQDREGKIAWIILT